MLPDVSVVVTEPVAPVDVYVRVAIDPNEPDPVLIEQLSVNVCPEQLAVQNDGGAPASLGKVDITGLFAGHIEEFDDADVYVSV